MKFENFVFSIFINVRFIKKLPLRLLCEINLKDYVKKFKNMLINRSIDIKINNVKKFVLKENF